MTDGTDTLFEQALEKGAHRERLGRAEAMALAAQDPRPEFAERVRFLQAGLEHARLSARFIGMLDPGGALPTHDAERFQAARSALEELIRFRRANEHLYIAEYIAASVVEHRQIDISTLLDADFEDIRRGGH